MTPGKTIVAAISSPIVQITTPNNVSKQVDQGPTQVRSTQHAVQQAARGLGNDPGDENDKHRYAELRQRPDETGHHLVDATGENIEQIHGAV